MLKNMINELWNGRGSEFLEALMDSEDLNTSDYDELDGTIIVNERLQVRAYFDSYDVRDARSAADYIEWLGFNAVATEIRQGKRVSENIDYIRKNFELKAPVYYKFNKLDTTRQEVLETLEQHQAETPATPEHELKFIELQRELDNATWALVTASKNYDNMTTEQWEDGKEYNKLSNAFEAAQDRYQAAQAALWEQYRENK